ncbi:MAG TPA: hypothetical protein DCE41_19480 [Cytophagales bacterium]|nr:hypothetical protein [Cytophagales bacterium]HAA18187.1 hypothetical protein [Cytophagales bacterium]HAP59780.1 hypothetical protein [Cytophagales bacterium]
MKALLQMAAWDAKIQARYQIPAVGIVLTGLYWILFRSLPFEDIDGLVIVCVYSDPAALGMVFIGALILFEKNERTLQVMAISPVTPAQYLWSKVISMTGLALFLGVALAIVGHGWDLNYLWLVVGITMTAVFFTFVGFLAVARVKSINEYIFLLFPVLVIFNLPILNFLEVTDTWIWYLIPSQGSFLLLEAGFGRDIETWQYVYSLLALPVATFFAYRMSLRAYERHIVAKL